MTLDDTPPNPSPAIIAGTTAGAACALLMMHSGFVPAGHCIAAPFIGLIIGMIVDRCSDG